MKSVAVRSGALSRIQDFYRDRKGVSAVEFATVLPFMLIAYLGSVEVGNGINAKVRVAQTTRTVADLATQYFTIKNADMTGILSASSAVMAPFSTSSLVITLSEVTTDASGNATITWSDSLNGSPRAVGQPVTLPSGLQTPNISLIWSEVKYAYTPNLGYVMTGTYDLTDKFYLNPRLSAKVCQNTANC